MRERGRSSLSSRLATLKAVQEHDECLRKHGQDGTIHRAKTHFEIFSFRAIDFGVSSIADTWFEPRSASNSYVAKQ